MPKPDDAAKIDPRPGERWEHHDGGTIYVFARSPRMVDVARYPGYPCYRWWIRLSTFLKWTTGRLEP